MLSHGIIRGGTGGTNSIVNLPRLRGAMLLDVETEVFDAEIDIGGTICCTLFG